MIICTWLAYLLTIIPKEHQMLSPVWRIRSCNPCSSLRGQDPCRYTMVKTNFMAKGNTWIETVKSGNCRRQTRGPASDNCHCPGWPTRSWCKTLLLKTAQTLIRGLCGINNLEASSLLASSQSTGRCYAGCSEKKVVNSLAQGPTITTYNIGVSYNNDQCHKIWPSMQQRHKR